jgi:hypothetical protein
MRAALVTFLATLQRSATTVGVAAAAERGLITAEQLTGCCARASAASAKARSSFVAPRLLTSGARVAAAAAAPVPSE